MKPQPHVFAVILAGGSGTRFWPLSRQLYPKQLLRIMGQETMIQQTMRRVLGCVPPTEVLISTNPQQADSIRVQLGDWKDALRDNFVIEPEGRNTAPAIGLVALEVVRRNPNGIMLVLPADHIVKREARFQAAVSLGATLATAGHLVTFGITPIRPETGYGYIQPNQKRTLGRQGKLLGHPVARFVEKPNPAKARSISRRATTIGTAACSCGGRPQFSKKSIGINPRWAQALRKFRRCSPGGALALRSKTGIDHCPRSRSIRV